MGYQKKQNLKPDIPIRNNLQSRKLKFLINRKNDKIENQDLQKITLDNGIPHEIKPETFAQNFEAFAVRKFLFKKNDGKRTC
jgi:hypothetical protein